HLVRQRGDLRVRGPRLDVGGRLDTDLRPADGIGAWSATDHLRGDRDCAHRIYPSKQHRADAGANGAPRTAPVVVWTAWAMSNPEEPLVARLFAQLADGQFHSGEALAEELAVSRSAIWKAARALRALGATVHAVRNRGYRL